MATSVFDKLNLKDLREIVVIGAPASFQPELRRLRHVDVRTKLSSAPVSFVLSFVTKQAEVNALARDLARRAEGDAIVWFAYPKASSKRYTCEFNRDNGWAAMGAAGFEPVRMVAIDEDWSALRFRRVEFIKTLQRGSARALTAEGRKRATGN